METHDISRALHAEADAVKPEMLRRGFTSNSVPRQNSARVRVRRNFLIAAVLLIAASATIGVVALNRNKATEAQSYAGIGVLHEEPISQSVEGACGPGTTADDLGDVAKISDAVFVGTVVSTSPDAPSDPSTLSLSLPRKLTVQVKQQVDGTLRSGESVSVIEPGWVRDSKSSTDWYPMSVGGWPRLETGSTAIFPLQMQSKGEYAFLCSGPLLVNGDTVANGKSDAGVNKEAYGKSVKSVISEIRAESN